MKKDTKRILKKMTSMLIVFAMIVSMFSVVGTAPMKAKAESATMVYIVDTLDGATETLSDTDVTDEVGKYSWDADTATLTLNGFNGEYIEANGDINIVLKGNNTVTVPAYFVGTAYGIYSSDGSIVITDDGVDGEDTLTVTQTGFINDEYAYVYGVYAEDDLIIQGSSKVCVNFAGADASKDYRNRQMYGLSPGNGHVYVKDSASLDIDITENASSIGIIRSLYAQTSGSIDINIYDADTTDSNYSMWTEVCGGICHSGTGTVSLKTSHGEAIDGYLTLTESAGTLTFKGRVGLGTSNNIILYKSSYYIPESKKIKVAGNESLETGFGYVDFIDYNTPYGYLLMDSVGNLVTEGTIETVANNPLYFMDYSGLDITELKVGTYMSTDVMSGFIFGGKSPYTVTVSEEPGYGLPAGLELGAYLTESRSDLYINGTPTAECDAGTIRLVVTDALGATDYIDIAYDAIITTPKNITVDGTTINMKNNGSGTGWSYVGNTKTLTLNGYNGGVIESEDGINIVLKGDNRITLPADFEDTIYGINSEEGSIIITDDGEAGQDTLTIIQTGFINDEYAYVYGVYAEDDLIIQGSSKVCVNFAGADASEDYRKRQMYGLSPGNGCVYVKDSASLDIDITENERSIGIIRPLYAQTSGSIDINIYDADTTDSNYSMWTEVCGGICHSGTGTVSLKTSHGEAIDGYLTLTESAGTLTFKGRVGLGTSNNIILYKSSYYIPESKKIKVAGNESLETGFGYVDFIDYNTPYGYLLMDSVGNLVTEGTIETVANNPLYFMDYSGLDITELKVGTYMSTDVMSGLIFGGKSPYTVTVSEEPGYGLPAGLELGAYLTESRSDLYINGTPTAECLPGTIRLIVTDALGATDYIDIAYEGTSISSPVTSVAIDVDEMTIDIDEEKTLTATVLPDSASFKTVTWSSSDNGIVYINSNTGAITGKKVGVATITVTTTQGKFKDTCLVYVREEKPQPQISGDYIIDLEKSANYTVNGTEYTSDDQGRIQILDAWRNTTVAIVKTNTEVKCNSAAYNLYIANSTAIDIATLSNQAVLEDVDYTYDGTAKTPDVTIPGLTKGTDYVLSYTDNVNASDFAVVNVTAAGSNYFGSFSLCFTIKKATLSGITATAYEGGYDKMGHTFTLSGVPAGAKLDYSTDGENYYSAKPTRIDVGRTDVYYRIRLDNYEDYIGTTYIEIGGASIDSAGITLEYSSIAYDGSAKKPVVSVKDGSSLLVQGTDYDVEYSNNTNVGTASVTVTGKGLYNGIVKKTFKITPKKITPTVTLSKTTFTYNGKAQKPTVTVKDGSAALSSDDYTVTYPSGMMNAGTYKVTVALKGNYSGSTTVTYKIAPKSITPTVTLSKTSYTYNGKVQKPTVTVKNGSTTLSNANYTVTYPSGMKNSGSYKVKVTLKGNYSGSVTKSYNITPSTVKSFAYKTRTASSITLKWAKNTSATGYVIQQYKGGKWTTIKTITSNATVSYKVSNLKPSTSYNFRIRAYKLSGSTKIYGSYVTKKVMTTPSTVKSFTYKTRTKTTITLKWAKNTSATGYVIQQYKGGKWTTIKTITKNSTVSYKVSKLKKGTSYKFRIKAYKTSSGSKIYGATTTKTIKTLTK